MMATRAELLEAVVTLKAKLDRSEETVAALLGKTPAEFRAMTPEARNTEAADLRTKAREKGAVAGGGGRL
jgi:hypothetical protein